MVRLIEVILSGEAINNPPTGLHVDPFWAFFPSDPTTIQGTAVRFRLSFTGCAAALECNAPDIILFMVFTDGVGLVTPPNVDDLDPMPIAQLIPIMQQIIPYTTTHSYHFVIDVGSTPRFLTMGDGDGGTFDNSGQFNIQLFSVTEGIPFANFSARLQANMNEEENDDTFQVNASFALGQGNDGINPSAEPVILQVGKISKRIPAGSFTKNKQGVFNFDGVIEGTKIKATLTPKKGGYDFQAIGTGANLNESELPLFLGLTIGNDAGRTLLTNTNLTAESTNRILLPNWPANAA